MRTCTKLQAALCVCSLGLHACDPADDGSDGGLDGTILALDGGHEEDDRDAMTGSSGRGGNGTGSGGSGNSDVDASMGPTDSGSDAGTEPFTLEGRWLDMGLEVIITQPDPTTVEGTYVETRYCDHETGWLPPGEVPGPDELMESTEGSFTGNLEPSGLEALPGAVITGITTVCLWGHAADSGAANGIVSGDIVLEVIDRNTLEGTWSNDDIPDEPLGGTVYITRL